MQKGLNVCGGGASGEPARRAVHLICGMLPIRPRPHLPLSVEAVQDDVLEVMYESEAILLGHLGKVAKDLTHNTTAKSRTKRGKLTPH